MKNVVIREVAGEYQLASVDGGLYNTIVGCGTLAAAKQYASDRGWRFKMWEA